MARYQSGRSKNEACFLAGAPKRRSTYNHRADQMLFVAQRSLQQPEWTNQFQSCCFYSLLSLSSHRFIITPTIFLNPSISSSTINPKPEASILQPTYTGTPMRRASILAVRVAYSTLAGYEYSVVDMVEPGDVRYETRQQGIDSVYAP